MPGLITVVLCVRLPDQNQPLAARFHLHAIAKRVMDGHRVRGDLEGLQKRPEFVTARQPLHRRVDHAERFVVHVRRGSQPLGHGHLWPLMQLPNKLVGIRLGNLRLSHAMTLRGEKWNEKRFQATVLSSNPVN